MGPPRHGNSYLPFVDLVALEKVDDTTFRSIAPPFSPNAVGRAYGGHVYSQAVWAAAQTVKPGFVIHNVTGFFILAGNSSIPFVYRVQAIRDGRSYCTRLVNVTQAEGDGICFTCTCSFKLAEESHFDVQEKIDLDREYGAVLSGKKPEDWEELPSMDVPWYNARRKATGQNDEFPGLECRKVDMTAYNNSLSPFDRRQLFFYRTIGDLPPDPNIHACAHLYASDRNSLFVVANHFEVSEKFTHMASLSHTVVFHTPALHIMTQSQSEKHWFTQEVWTTRAGGGRATHHSRIIGPGGTHVATSFQEGMIRVGLGENNYEKAYKKSLERL
ncbi:Thioesterase/thiol ester dehydrase-isomerase, partial [Aureobasidium melanogenum]|uniref:Thioesterase/thiol ester dehydrase-isomerase n=1 Tax=Aureobasidium melanogenum (strain CBS 110374) TaxID=1043003 RepID=A0A074WH33_AURM1